VFGLVWWLLLSVTSCRGKGEYDGGAAGDLMQAAGGDISVSADFRYMIGGSSERSESRLGTALAE
jgi:hypothetical protein